MAYEAPRREFYIPGGIVAGRRLVRCEKRLLYVDGWGASKRGRGQVSQRAWRRMLRANLGTFCQALGLLNLTSAEQRTGNSILVMAFKLSRRVSDKWTFQ